MPLEWRNTWDHFILVLHRANVWNLDIRDELIWTFGVSNGSSTTEKRYLDLKEDRDNEVLVVEICMEGPRSSKMHYSNGG